MTGFEEMMRMVMDLPSQLKEGYRLSKKASIPAHPSYTVVSGVGGSGIAGDVLVSLAAQAGSVPVFANRSFSLPKWTTDGAGTVFVSYSGDTAETLQAYAEAGRKGLQRTVVTSGGKLQRLAEAEGTPAVIIPPGRPPRVSVGYLVGALCGILESSFPPSALNIGSAASELYGLSKGITGKGGYPERVADGWGRRRLYTYVPERLAPVGRRWKTQAEENAKQPGHFDTVPEMLHNALVPWDIEPARDSKEVFATIISGPNDGAESLERMDYLNKVIEGRGGKAIRINLSSKPLLTEILEAIWIGDIASLLEAKNLGIDPMPVEPIQRLKAHFQGR